MRHGSTMTLENQPNSMISVIYKSVDDNIRHKQKFNPTHYRLGP